MSAYVNIAPSASAPRLHQRVRDSDGFYGTILYVGAVASAKKQTDTYCGVEWDDNTRGKHDGSVISRATNQIVRHFKCEDPSPTAGSFVKPAKLDFGVDFATTLSNRYVDPSAPLLAPDNKFDGCVAMTKSGRPKQIEFFGEEKVREVETSDVTSQLVPSLVASSNYYARNRSVKGSRLASLRRSR